MRKSSRKESKQGTRMDNYQKPFKMKQLFRQEPRLQLMEIEIPPIIQLFGQILS